MGKKLSWALKLFLILFLFVALFLPVKATQEKVPVKLQVEINGIKSSSGVLLVSLYNQANGFPDVPQLAYSKRVAKAQRDAVTLEWSSIAPGTYAIAVLHDENGDGKMNTNLLGIPSEGFGFSNNKLGIAGPPSFQRASFEIKKADTKIVIKLRN
ncbi:MAG: hypothetical protein RLZ05_393 [Bacteroidota bacterium]|jgi:uncharacterized protein (DUF2141 family)